MVFRKLILTPFIMVAATSFLGGCSDANFEVWHAEKLDEEFTQARGDEISDFSGYLELEDRLFKQLDERIYANSNTGPAFKIDRYSPGSAADPRHRSPDWNRSFELIPTQPRGAVLLLHGMSDSPYSLRQLGKTFFQNDYRVLGLRLPGHGTIPSGLRFIDRHDMTAAVRLAMRHLAESVNNRPVHVVGYSTGAALALELALDALDGKPAPVPASLILISPAIGVHSTAALARFKNSLAILPGLQGLAFLQILPEFDPYRYNSFATNAGDVVHRITRAVAGRVKQRAALNPERVLPPTLVLKSTVDATVSTDAVVDRLLVHLKPHRHELVLFDINRVEAVKARLLIENPAPLSDRLINKPDLPFALTLVSNENPKSKNVVSKTRPALSVEFSKNHKLDLQWPDGVISLSHIALPFPPDDPLYGQRPPNNNGLIFLGQLAIQGERGLLQLPADWMLRLRVNPFYDYLEHRSLEWVVRFSEN